jgi:phosphoribosylformylglycinamidine synthase I
MSAISHRSSAIPPETAMPRPRAIVLRAPGTNCDEETAAAWERAGAGVETWHVGRLLDAPEALDGFQILTIPGGFSYGDDLGAGRIFATRLGAVLGDALRRFRDRGGLVLGICNGFQVLVRAGFLPGGSAGTATLTFNDSGHFESRWVRLVSTPGLSPFLTDDEPIELPVAHGEGRFVVADAAALDSLTASGQVVLRYADEQGRPTQAYPANPNGSAGAVAGVCDPSGRVFGLMPHPERHVDPFHHPRWTRRGPAAEGDGLRIFRNAVAALR